MAAARKYPWEVWFGKQRIVLTQGLDYMVSQSTMYQTIRNNASRLGIYVNVTDTGCGMIIEVKERKQSEDCDTTETPIANEHAMALEETSSSKDETAQDSPKNNGRSKNRTATARDNRNTPRPTPIRR